MKYEIDVIRGVNRDIPRVKVTEPNGNVTYRFGKFVGSRDQILFRFMQKTLLLVRSGRDYRVKNQEYLVSSF